MARSFARWSGLTRLRRGLVAGSVGLAVALAFAPFASAATLTNAWQAKIGSSGANGTATINVYLTGTGSVALKLAKLKAATYLPVTLSKGTCGSVGSTLIKFALIKTTSSGAAARTTSLTVAQVGLVKNAMKANARIAIRVGSSTTGGIKCGVFAAVTVPPYVAAKITVGRSPSGVAVDPSGVWVTNWLDNTLTKIDPVTNTSLSVIPVTLTGDAGLESVASGAGSLWVTTTEFDSSGNTLPGSLIRLDPATGTVLATIPIGKGAFDVAVGLGGVWVPNFHDNTVLRIDTATNQVVATIPINGGPSGVATDASAAWVVSGDGTVSRIDPATNQVAATIHTQPTGGYIAVGPGSVWATNPGTKGQADGALSRIDTATNQVVANVPLGYAPEELVVAGGSIWVGMFAEHTVVRVNATTNAVLSRISVSANVYSIDASAHVVWAVHNLPAPDATSPIPAGVLTRINY